jgi:hypothetical protein
LIYPSSAGLREEEPAADLLDPVLKEQEVVSPVREARDETMRNLAETFGLAAAKAIRANLAVRIGVKTKTAPSIRSTFFSNDGRMQYSGHVRGMRQKILEWAKENDRMLPAGFENRTPSAITGMFRGMVRGENFS